MVSLECHAPLVSRENVDPSSLEGRGLRVDLVGVEGVAEGEDLLLLGGAVVAGRVVVGVPGGGALAEALGTPD